jgi:hypothetical protein
MAFDFKATRTSLRLFLYISNHSNKRAIKILFTNYSKLQKYLIIPRSLIVKNIDRMRQVSLQNLIGLALM